MTSAPSADLLAVAARTLETAFRLEALRRASEGVLSRLGRWLSRA